jgi:MoxR-like ATPase
MSLTENATKLASAITAGTPAVAFVNAVVSAKGCRKDGGQGPAQVCKRILLSRLARCPNVSGVPEEWHARSGETYELLLDGAPARFTFLVTAAPKPDFWTNVSRSQLRSQRDADAIFLAIWNRPVAGDSSPANQLEAFSVLPEMLEDRVAANWVAIARDRCGAFLDQFATYRDAVPGLGSHLVAALGAEATWSERATNQDAPRFLQELEQSLIEWIDNAKEKSARDIAKKKLLEVARKLEIHVRLSPSGFQVRYGNALTLFDIAADQGMHATLHLNEFEAHALRQSFGESATDGARVTASATVAEAANITPVAKEEADLAADDDVDSDLLASLRDRVEATERLLAHRVVGVPINQLLMSTWAALDAGKHVVLTGAPGTAKTTIAAAIAEVAESARLCTGALFTTATTDWTSLDTVGGYVPNPDGGGLLFQPGKFLQCLMSDGLKDNRWLVIDELNRADMDKAFGPFFTVLSGHSSELPYRAEGRSILILSERSEKLAKAFPADRYLIYRVPESWRMIGTLNTTDKASLYEMSFAFMRRFAFVHVPLPGAAGLHEIGRKVLVGQVALETRRAESVVGLWERLSRLLPMGPAILIDMARYLKKRVVSEDAAEWDLALSESLAMYLVPQLEGCEATQIGELRNLCGSHWSAAVEAACVAFVPAAKESTRTESNSGAAESFAQR